MPALRPTTHPDLATQPVALTPAPPGHRAVIVAPDGWHVAPVVGYALVEWVVDDHEAIALDEAHTAPPGFRAHDVEAVIAGPGGPGVGTWTGSAPAEIARYLGPDEPDPAFDDAELASRVEQLAARIGVRRGVMA